MWMEIKDRIFSQHLIAIEIMYECHLYFVNSDFRKFKTLYEVAAVMLELLLLHIESACCSLPTVFIDIEMNNLS